MEDELSTLFKALGHPIRRRILDILKQSAKTTGELNEYFPEVTRYAIMKHLTILEEGNLVVVRREGKYRRNFLNAVPLQEMHNRWVGKYMQSTANTLLNLQAVVEKKGDLMMTTTDQEQSRAFRIEQEVLIAAPREQVFKALTEQAGDWWEFRLAPKGVSSHFSFEPVPGGQFIEKWGEHEGAVWGNVYYVNAPEEIRLHGHLGMQGAVNSSYVYRLLEKEGATLLQLSHTASGVIEENWEQEHSEGWKHLLGTLLKNYVEQAK
ncbi:helix-turn-helix domain-containing protein [Metabacillus sediminilitoris]|uniref:ArsR family transcriptional regulator n=1 Tax=Metabacillus sediminilitoris TaxID=2567941 RepID=A0A4S4BXM3_9BACI|nr:helix-turn-helix domain-containing protein [Metabacillus sediminilitoris]QGQ48491.1 helix-turn-helix domain-containing protein [Metabacillus sediminilitoris]THF77879.1 ArsR family transcriptional regulator [Metabacillus sediminilitoris]